MFIKNIYTQIENIDYNRREYNTIRVEIEMTMKDEDMKKGKRISKIALTVVLFIGMQLWPVNSTERISVPLFTEQIKEWKSVDAYVNIPLNITERKTKSIGITQKDGRWVVRVLNQPDQYKPYVDIGFDYQGINQIYGMQRITYDDGITFQIGSDWIGPYQIASKKGKGKKSLQFTGGYHGTNGNETGHPTAHTTRIQWSLDGKPLDIDKDSPKGFLYGDRLKLDVVNEVQASGENKTAIREIQEYTFEDGHMEVAVTITALQDLSIRRYYGLQAQTQLWQKHTYYIYDNGAIDENGSMWESQSLEKGNPQKLRLDAIGLFDNNSKNGLIVSLYDVGLGTYEYVDDGQPMGFKMNYGKIYYDLVREKNLDLLKGQNIFWKGSYTWVRNQSVFEWYRSSSH